eukprot:scaffold1939_cov92-Cylindrotheca_fusiformis.AAC.2
MTRYRDCLKCVFEEDELLEYYRGHNVDKQEMKGGKTRKTLLVTPGEYPSWMIQAGPKKVLGPQNLATPPTDYDPIPTAQLATSSRRTMTNQLATSSRQTSVRNKKRTVANSEAYPKGEIVQERHQFVFLDSTLTMTTSLLGAFYATVISRVSGI